MHFAKTCVKIPIHFSGLYALSGTATAFLGHALVAAFTRVYGSRRAGFASLIILLAGLELMFRVRRQRAEEIIRGIAGTVYLFDSASRFAQAF